jgi:hypothetical protein
MVVITVAVIGLMIVIAPVDVADRAGLLELRRAYDHAFGILVLLLTAWGSWILSVQAAERHVRGRFLARVPATFKTLDLTHQRYLAACLEADDLTITCRSHDIIARALCELGLLVPLPDALDDPFRLQAAYAMAPDVAESLRARVRWGGGPGRRDEAQAVS